MHYGCGAAYAITIMLAASGSEAFLVGLYKGIVKALLYGYYCGSMRVL